MWYNDDLKDIDLENLQILHIIDVSSLQYIFYLYPPEKLDQLKELIIEKCEDLYITFLWIILIKVGQELTSHHWASWSLSLSQSWDKSTMVI